MTTAEQLLTQVVEFGRIQNGHFHMDHAHAYAVSPENRVRITRREMKRSTSFEKDGWFYFLTHPSVKGAEDCFTRIKWEDN